MDMTSPSTSASPGDPLARLSAGLPQLQAPRLAQAMLGRGEELARVAELLQQHRLVTIAGPGGMGKTTLARAVAALCAEVYADGVVFIDLAVLAQGRELDGALAAALGITQLARDPLPQLGARLRGQRVMFVFDCC
jgi:predicted ATPase